MGLTPARIQLERSPGLVLGPVPVSLVAERRIGAREMRLRKVRPKLQSSGGCRPRVSIRLVGVKNAVHAQHVIGVGQSRMRERRIE